MGDVPNPPAFSGQGMSLRDYFAASAPVSDTMAAHAMGCDEGIDLTDDTARVAMCAVWAMMRYEFADAMLLARTKGDAA